VAIATRIDGRKVAGDLKAQLAGRVGALHAQGIRPGLGTILVGDDPGSHSYVAGKHRDCADVGIESIRVELPATATQAEIEAAVTPSTTIRPVPGSSFSFRCRRTSTPTGFFS